MRNGELYKSYAQGLGVIRILSDDDKRAAFDRAITSAPIDRDLLKDMGFELGTGWPGETWVYDGDFWVHFYPHPAEDCHIDYMTPRCVFFRMFIEFCKNPPDYYID
jgi:hypothetical protein